MNVNIRSQEHQTFIDEQVRAGRFASAEELVANAIADLIVSCGNEEDFDEATAKKLNEAYERGLQGQGGYTIEQARHKVLASQKP